MITLGFLSRDPHHTLCPLNLIPSSQRRLGPSSKGASGSKPDLDKPSSRNWALTFVRVTVNGMKHPCVYILARMYTHGCFIPFTVTLTKVRAQFLELGLSKSGFDPLAPFELGPNLRWDDGIRFSGQSV